MIRVAQTTDTHPCFDLRRTVFIEEQGIPEAEEFDAYDATARHLLAWEGTTPVGTARVHGDRWGSSTRRARRTRRLHAHLLTSRCGEASRRR